MKINDYNAAFDEIIQMFAQTKQEEARNKVETLILSRVDVSTSNNALLAHIIASSLLKRIDRKLMDSKHIYLQKFDIPQIELFYEMAKVFPHVALSHNIANQYLKTMIANLDQFTLFEIGLGKGKQIIDLLQLIKENEYPITHINIIGLDPDINNVQDGEANIAAYCEKNNISFKFYPICKLLENFTDDDFTFIKEIGGESLLINSAYTLHHISHAPNDNEQRTKIFKKLHDLSPLLMTIIEPNSNHDTDKITQRIKNCWEFFQDVFTLIDESNVDSRHRYLIKEKFFGRELRDIFGVSDFVRTERHEDCESWIVKLHKAGFVPYQFKDINVDLPDYCSYAISDGHTALSYNNRQLIAVLAYQPK